jgi:hypothetical protein
MSPPAFLRPASLAGAAGLLAALAGCSVLTVDVDVYKGSLANHQHVQTEQLAVMAMGAKPLLVRLRDQSLCKKQKNSSWYEPGYVAPDPSGASRFGDSLADCVNGILYLYDDRPSPDPALKNFVRLGRKAIEKYRTSYSCFRPEDSSGDRRLWSEVQRAIKEPGKLGQAIVDDYRDFLTDRWKEAKGLLSTAFEKNIGEIGDRQRIVLTGSSNAAFAYLAESRIVDRHADALGLVDPVRSRFIGRVKEISRAFLESRAALEEVWNVILELIVALHPDAAEQGSEASPPLRELDGKLAAFLVRLIQPEHLGGVYRLMKEADKQLIPSFLAEFLQCPPENQNKYDKQLTDLIAGGPLEAAKALRAMHQDSKTVEFGNLVGGHTDLGRPSMAYPEGWKFGLVRGPTTDLPDPSKLLVEFQGSAGTIGGPLAGGRLDAGLETVIETYLEAVQTASGQETEEVLTARQKLIDELVHFAEKLIFLGNHERLINAPTAGGGILGIYNNVLIRNIAESIPIKDFYGEGTSRYIQVFQAIGNSILVQADELRHRVEHGKRLKDRRMAEVSALFGWYDRDADKILDDLVEGLRAERKTREAAARQGAGKDDGSRKGTAVARATDEAAEAIKAKVAEVLAGIAKSLRAPFDRWVEALRSQMGIPGAGPRPGAPASPDLCDGRAEAGARDDLGRYDDAIDVVQALKSEAATRAKAHDRRCSPDLVFRILLARVREALAEVRRGGAGAWCPWAGLSRESQAKKLEDAIGVLEENFVLMAPPEVREALLSGKVIDSKDVLDLLISALRHQHIRAVREFGEGSDQEKRIASTIEAAYTHRAGMVFIRPPSAFLRTSYAVSSLQSDPNIEWRNMLLGHSLRSIPFAMEIRNLIFPWKKREAIVQAEIDKQFWQNINRVRVAGAGFTNYAVVKDDVGNWYVKSYSTNPKDIINSAKNLALFGMGSTAAGANLQNLSPGDPRSLAAGKPAGPSSSWRKARFEAYRKKFDETTVRTAKDLQEETKGLKEQILKRLNKVPGYDGHRDDFDLALADPPPAEISANPEKDPMLRRRILDRLKAIEDYRRSVKKLLKGRHPAPDVDFDNARQTVDDVIVGLLSRFIERRRADVNDYNTALSVLSGDGDKDPEA